MTCPEKYCFFWSNGKCDGAYKNFDSNYDCLRRNPKSSHDWYEPCEPELIADNLPLDYFCSQSNNDR